MGRAIVIMLGLAIGAIRIWGGVTHVAPHLLWFNIFKDCAHFFVAILGTSCIYTFGRWGLWPFLPNNWMSGLFWFMGLLELAVFGLTRE